MPSDSRRRPVSDAADAAAPAPAPPPPPPPRLRSHGPTFLHISLVDWLLGAVGAVAFVLYLQATPLPLAPLSFGFDLAAGAQPLRLWPPALPAGAAPPPARALLEGRAGLFVLGAGAAAPAPPLPLVPLSLPFPFLPLPRALRANASVALELALLRGSAEAAAAAELCVSVEDARGEDITRALAPFAAAAACGAQRGRRLELSAMAAAAAAAAPPVALATAAATFSLPPGARLGVTLSTGRGSLAGELRLSVAAAAAATGGLAVVVR